MSENNSDKKEMFSSVIGSFTLIGATICYTVCQLSATRTRSSLGEREIWRAHYIHTVNQNSSAQPQHRFSHELFKSFRL